MDFTPAVAIVTWYKCIGDPCCVGMEWMSKCITDVIVQRVVIVVCIGDPCCVGMEWMSKLVYH